MPTLSSERRRETHGADHEEHLGGLATEDQKLDSDTGAAGDVAADGRAAAVSTKEHLPTVGVEAKRAKAPRSCLAGADAGYTAITVGEELDALYLSDLQRRRRRNPKLRRQLRQ